MLSNLVHSIMEIFPLSLSLYISLSLGLFFNQARLLPSYLHLKQNSFTPYLINSKLGTKIQVNLDQNSREVTHSNWKLDVTNPEISNLRLMWW